MKLWKEDGATLNPVPEKVYKTIKSPEKIQGFAGCFKFCFGQIWIDDKIEESIKNIAEFEKLLEDLLKRFRADDYGNVSQQERELNLENKYFFGCFVGLKGKYDTQFGTISIEIEDSDTTHILMCE